MGLIKKLFGRKAKKDAPPIEPAPAPSPPPEPGPIKINEISPYELKARLDNEDELIVIDMRQGWEYQAGHIPGATHMFIQEIPMRINELPKDQDVVFQCWHGHTSLDAAGFLIQNGWEAARVFSLIGGMSGWASTFGQNGLVKD